MADKRAPNTWLDRAIQWVSPERGFRRQQYRLASSIARGVDATASNRLRSDWTNVTQDADTAAKASREKVRNIVRELVRNNPYAAGAAERKVANIVGAGIRPQCALEADTPESTPAKPPPGWQKIDEKTALRFQTQAEELWAEFADNCDVGRRLNFYEIEAAAERARIADGEVILHIPRLPRSPVGFGVELIEADRLGLPIGKATDPKMRDGVEIDLETGEPVAYHIRTTHPGDSITITPITAKYLRYPRFNDDETPRTIHYYDPLRPGQTRGITEFLPCLTVFQDLHRYWEAEIVAARVAACFTMGVTSPGASLMAANKGTANSAGDREDRMQPGQIWYGMPGEQITFGNPMRPNAQFGPFTEILLRAIGTALGMPYELVSMDFSKANYSNARAAMLEARRHFQYRQQFLINQIGVPLWRAVIRAGIVRGRLEAPGYAARMNDYLASFWTPPAWGWVDPVKEETAARESIRAYLSTHGDELAAQGRDAEQTFRRCAREHARLKALGLPSPWDAVAPPGEKSVVPGEKPKDEDEDAEKDKDPKDEEKADAEN